MPRGGSRLDSAALCVSLRPSALKFPFTQRTQRAAETHRDRHTTQRHAEGRRETQRPQKFCFFAALRDILRRNYDGTN